MMSEQNLDIERISPLDDLPVTQDKFKGQSHENVADALVKLISKSEGGYAIGLEGSWGSGKSSVIRIAEKKFEDEKKHSEYLFYTFDAWAHQGDPIRRSFLECLFGYLEEKNIVSKRNWITRLRKIRAQQKKVVSESIPKIPAFNYIMVLYGLLLPFIFIWANDFYNPEKLNTIVIPALIIVGIPAIIAIWTHYYRKWTDSEYKELPVLPSTRYLTEKSKTEEYVHTEDATTIEFNRYFDNLVSKALEKNKKIIVVVDNLDRLTPESIKSMWGTMRNFFTSEYWSDRHELLKNVYLIVPYDRNYISKIFLAEEETQSHNKFTEEKLKQNNRSESGFIDKTFKLSFQVSPPILSHWKSFFLEQLDKAFHDQLKDSQKHDIYKLFEFRFQNKGESITPRSIKKFINSLVVQVIEWKNKIPVKYLALYVLHKDNITLNYRKFVESKVLDQRTRQYLTGEKWAKYLAAAYHKVDPDSALQISLGQPIRNALVNSNHSDLEDLQNNEWFASTLNFVIEENSKNWASTEPDTYSVVASTLSKIDIKNNHIEQDIWDDLAKNIRSFTNIKAPSEKLANGLGIILKNASKHLLYESGKNIYKPIYSGLDDDMDLKSYAADYFDYISITYSVLEERLGESSSLDRLQHTRLPNEPKFFIYFASKIHGFNNVKLSHLSFNGSPDEITQETRNFISSDNIFDKLPDSIKGFLEANIELDWKAIAQEIQNRIRNNNPKIAGKQLGNLIYILILLEQVDKGNANSILTSLVNDGVMLSLFSRASGDEFTKAIILLRIIHRYEDIDRIPTNNNVPTYGNNNSSLSSLKEVCREPEESREVIQEMLNMACELDYFQVMLKTATTNDDYELPKVVVNKMIEKGCLKGINVKGFIKDSNYIEVISEEDNLDRFFELLEDIEFDPNSINSLENISIASLEGAIETDSRLGDLLVEKIKGDLKGLDPDEWEPIVEEESHEIDLLLILIKEGNISFLAEDFSQSLLDNSIKLLEEEIAFPEKSDQWYLLPKALSPNTRGTFYERLYANLVSYNKKQVFKLINLFADDFLKSIDITEEANLFTKNVVSMLVNSDEIEMLEWTRARLDIVSDCYKQSTDETQDYIVEILESKEKESKKIKEEIYQIAEGLGIDISWNNTENEDED